MAQIHGHCDPAFTNLKDLLQENLTSGEEVGVSIAVNIAGKTVVDLWGGYMDEARTRPWTESTLTPVWSVTKTVVNLAALLLIDKGLLDPYAPVAKYWPEFGVNGKQDIQVRHLLSHTSGLSTWEKPMTIEDIYDSEKATRYLAEQAPLWTPGSASGYQMMNHGYLVGEVVKRVSGKSIKEFIRDELANALDVGDDFQIGVSEKDWHRVADVVPPPPFNLPDNIDQNSIFARTFANSPREATHCMTPEFRKSELAATNGFGNARSIARIHSIIVALGGEQQDDEEEDGNSKRPLLSLLSPKTIDLAFKEQSNSTDLVLGMPIRFGMGYALPIQGSAFDYIPQSKSGRVGFWFGWGGSVVIVDVDRKMTIAYAMNRMGMGMAGTSRTEAYVKEIYNVVGRE